MIITIFFVCIFLLLPAENFAVLYIYASCFYVFCSSLPLDLLWKDFGKSNLMNRKSSGLLIVLIIQKKALLHLLGCNYHPTFNHNEINSINKKFNGSALRRRGHLFDHTCATIIYEMCLLEPTATVSLFGRVILPMNKLVDFDRFWHVSLLVPFDLQVTNVRHQEKPKYPPYPLSTIELEKRASRYFRMSSALTMKVSSCLMRMRCVMLILLFVDFTKLSV